MAGGVAINVDAGSEERTEGTRTYAIIVCLFASLGGLYFGYDQGVSGGVVVMDGFVKDFCIGIKDDITYDSCMTNTSNLPGAWSTFVQNYTLVYDVGCVVGAIVGGWVADKLGRRWTIFSAGVFFCIGTFGLIFNPAHKITQILIVRFIQGMGVGNSSFSLPLFGAEIAPKELRGFLSGFMQMTIVTGLMASNIVNQIVKDNYNGWRVTNGVAVIPPIIVMLGIFFVPESPRWLYSHKGKEVAEAALKKIRQTENIHKELESIGDQIAEEGNEAPWSALLEPSIMRRVLITMFLQVLQQATGINPMFLFGGMIFNDITGKSTGILQIFLLSVVNFLSTIPAMRWVDTTGRRKLLLIGAVGMVTGHLLAAITFIAGCSGDTNKTHCSTFSGYFIVASVAFFIFNFAISWGPVCWIYPPEVFPLNVRAKAVSLSTMANWLMACGMTFVVKLFHYLNIHGVFLLFAVTCTGAGAFVYFFCPETKGLLLEDIEELFGKKRADNGSPKYLAGETPLNQA